MPRCIEAFHQLFEGTFDVRFNVAQAQKHWCSGCLPPEEDQPAVTMSRELVGTAAYMTAHTFAQEALYAVPGNGKGRNTLGNTNAVLDMLVRCLRLSRGSGR